MATTWPVCSQAAPQSASRNPVERAPRPPPACWCTGAPCQRCPRPAGRPWCTPPSPSHYLSAPSLPASTTLILTSRQVRCKPTACASSTQSQTLPALSFPSCPDLVRGHTPSTASTAQQLAHKRLASTLGHLPSALPAEQWNSSKHICLSSRPLNRDQPGSDGNSGGAGARAGGRPRAQRAPGSRGARGRAQEEAQGQGRQAGGRPGPAEPPCQPAREAQPGQGGGVHRHGHGQAGWGPVQRAAGADWRAAQPAACSSRVRG